jgi:hypothetical protein
MEEVANAEFEAKIASLSPYYQEEFRKIYESRGAYKGKWNWWAFLFGGFWLLYKRCWFTGVGAIAISSITVGLTIWLIWAILGFRGNYIYYQNYINDEMFSI